MKIMKTEILTPSILTHTYTSVSKLLHCFIALKNTKVMLAARSKHTDIRYLPKTLCCCHIKFEHHCFAVRNIDQINAVYLKNLY